MRWLYLFLGSVVLSLAIFSTQLAVQLGYASLLITLTLLVGSGLLYLKSVFPSHQDRDLERAPEELEGKAERALANRAGLVFALSLAALFAPIWIWILPLFAAQAAFRASRQEGGLEANFAAEIKASLKYLGRTAANLLFFLFALLVATVTILGSGAVLYFTS